MNLPRRPFHGGPPDGLVCRRGFTVIEMLVVISIIGLLIALLFPALNAARESGRRATCQSNLRQIGVGLQDHASRHGTYCSGAFDWRRDGCVTEVGWVADLVDQGIPVGQMLCPSNEITLSETYNDLMTLTEADIVADSCKCITLEDMKGSSPSDLPSGAKVYNPCRYILDNPDGLDMSPGSPARLLHLKENLLEKHYNTNYTATWVLICTEPSLTRSGNLKSILDDEGTAGGCGSLEHPESAIGPLTLKRVDASPRPASFIPVLGCGGGGAPLKYGLDDDLVGTWTARSFTAGPVLTQDVPADSYGPFSALNPPGPFDEPNEADPGPPPVPADSGTPRDGPLGTGWWAAWDITLQDYRAFAPVHSNGVNLLFADGSVRNFHDENEDWLLNNGFTTALAPGAGFTDDRIEIPEEGVFSGWTLAR